MQEILRQLKILYNEQQFHPGPFAVIINPFYFARKQLRDSVALYAPTLQNRLLDVGCGSQPYRRYFHHVNYVGLDIDTPLNRTAAVADYFYNGEIFPFDDNSFDSVLCNQVLEHVFNPERFLSEIHRVLKPGGYLLLTVPFVWDEHEQPYDCARYTTFGLKSLMESKGLRWLKHDKLGNDATILFQMLNTYLFKIARVLPKWPFLLFSCTIMAMINCIGLIVIRFLPKNDDLYLDHVVLAENIK
jgi:SAM-dependent methyltransferase